MYTLGLDTIAGSRLLRLRFGSAGVFQPDQAVMHGDRRARFIRISDGAAIIHHWGDSHPIAVSLETLSLPSASEHHPVPRAPAGADTRRVGTTSSRRRRVVRAGAGLLPRHHPQRRPRLDP
jgi:hypothetical protein